MATPYVKPCIIGTFFIITASYKNLKHHTDNL